MVRAGVRGAGAGADSGINGRDDLIGWVVRGHSYWSGRALGINERLSSVDGGSEDVVPVTLQNRASNSGGRERGACRCAGAGSTGEVNPHVRLRRGRLRGPDCDRRVLAGNIGSVHANDRAIFFPAIARGQYGRDVRGTIRAGNVHAVDLPLVEERAAERGGGDDAQARTLAG